jgi:hypothetical protein
MSDDQPEASYWERAQSIRRSLEQSLGWPRDAYNPLSGERWEEPPVADEFQLQSVRVGGSEEKPIVEVVFKWDGEDGVFGMRWPIGPCDPVVEEPHDRFISVYVEENLNAEGMGIQNAAREIVDGVIWLNWDSYWTRY